MLNVSVIVCKDLVTSKQAEEVLSLCLSELNGTIKNKDLFLNNKFIGTVSISNRIVLTADNNVFLNTKNEREKLRNLITKKLDVMQNNYINDLEIEKEKLKNSQMALEELKKEISAIDKIIHQSEIAKRRQALDECHALEQELCEEAENQGFDVVKENTEEGIQLQFIRREY